MNKYLKKDYKTLLYFIIKSIAGFILFISVMILVPAIAETIENYYSMDGIIINVNSDEVSVEDSTGNIWTFFEKGYFIGDEVRIIFFNNHTDNTRVDDKIMRVIK